MTMYGEFKKLFQNKHVNISYSSPMLHVRLSDCSHIFTSFDIGFRNKRGDEGLIIEEKPQKLTIVDENTAIVDFGNEKKMSIRTTESVNQEIAKIESLEAQKELFRRNGDISIINFIDYSIRKRDEHAFDERDFHFMVAKGLFSIWGGSYGRANVYSFDYPNEYHSEGKLYMILDFGPYKKSKAYFDISFEEAFDIVFLQNQ